MTANPSGTPARQDAGSAPIRLLVVDDQTLVREGLVTLLGLLPGIAVAGAAADGLEAVHLAAQLQPDVILMDLRMPRCDGVEATRRIRAARPDARVLVLTTYADDESVLAALQAGALGYLTKDSGAQEIRQAIETVHAGLALLDPAVQRRLLASLRSTSPPAPVGTAQPPAATHATPVTPPPEPPDGLTAREVEVLRLIAGGLSNQEIASRLVVGEATVKTHINNLFAKLGVRDRAQAVTYAYRHNLAADLAPPGESHAETRR